MPRKSVIALAAFAVVVPATIAEAGIAPNAPAAKGPRYPTVRVAPHAATPTMRRQILAVNRWWVRTHRSVPCEGCTVRPPQSSLIWTYYLNQGYFPNWVRATRDSLRHQARGDLKRTRTTAQEVIRASTLVTLPNGTRFRVMESAYRAPDKQPAPWRDAMGNGLALTLVIPALPDNPTMDDMAVAKRTATEFLNSFEVHWKAGGLYTPGPEGGRWYLEYAYANGNRARVLNGFMQSVVSLDRFARQTSDLVRYDPEWTVLRDRAELLVYQGVQEIVRFLPRYDMGDGWSRYSLTRAGRAPLKYHVYHRQLLLRLENITYLPENSRRTLKRFRVRWKGGAITQSVEPETVNEAVDPIDPPIPLGPPPGP